MRCCPLTQQALVHRIRSLESEYSPRKLGHDWILEKVS